MTDRVPKKSNVKKKAKAFDATVDTNELSWLLGRIEAARMCGVSPATWDRMTASGKNPRPLRLGSRVVWRRTDLKTWVAHGCPDRKTFDAIMFPDWGTAA